MFRMEDTQEVLCDGIFTEIGYVPNIQIFKVQIEVDSNGYIITDDGTRTNIGGVFAAGDVQGYV